MSPIRPERLDAADEDRDHDRSRGDRQIVPELADRVDERPAIGADHQHAVGGVHQRHAGGEQGRKHQDASRTTCPARPARRRCRAGRSRLPYRSRGRTGSRSGTCASDRETTLNIGRKERAKKPRPASSASRSSSTIGSPRRARENAAQMPSQDEQVGEADDQRNNAETAVPMTPPISWKQSS